jgi:hypothetical protein
MRQLSKEVTGQKSEKAIASLLNSGWKVRQSFFYLGRDPICEH